MKLKKLAILAAFVCGMNAANARENDSVFRAAAEGNSQPYRQVAPVGFCGGCEQSTCDCETACDESDACDAQAAEVAEACKLCKNPVFGIAVGGWTNMAYHSSNNTGAGILGGGPTGGAPANFNNYADHLQLQQQWLYAQRIADGSKGLGIGGRIDYLYGTDGPDTQSFGRADSTWDNSWDNGGAYGHAIPQLYGEAAYGKLSVKVGHFYTIIGNEVVQATGNFFYSRQFTFYNAEPFTHTGALTTYALSNNTTLYNGWVSGWDSGFAKNGSAYIGGIKHQFSDNFSALYTTALGRFNDDPNSVNVGERGQVHCMIFTTKMAEKLTNLVQIDYLDTTDANGLTVRNTFGMNNYFIYQISDKISLGSRQEWFNWTTGPNVPVPYHNNDLYNITYGINYKATSNLIFRPELRTIWDSNNTGVNENFAGSKTIYGMDAILTF